MKSFSGVYRKKMAEMLYKLNSGGDSKNSSQSDLKDYIDESNSENRHTSDELELVRSLLATVKYKTIDSGSSSIHEYHHLEKAVERTEDVCSFLGDLLPNYDTEVITCINLLLCIFARAKAKHPLR